ncbi:GTPase [Labrys portucalensis]|uniref:GTPase n=1 Tax=Labrys neptuniae TaxID=376174 RepID=A0ABV6ZN10_9HYPH
MKADTSHEQRFIAEIDAFTFLDRDLREILGRLDDWLAHLKVDLDVHRLVYAAFNESSAPARQAEAINSDLRLAVSMWSYQWACLEAARTLADAFDDKAVLLVFGKFNAGKSSLCNFLAERFAAQGKAVRSFHLDSGSIVETSERFGEGVTETTARLQGVVLGDKLVLLDTPGLHSVTPENALLARRFTDSADGVLWLTSSASPGQVQELEELTRELNRAKPLLPVITRSDLYEEDEIDGELVKHLSNKTAQNRAQQERDVTARAEEKVRTMGLSVAQLKAPVSISVHMAREQGMTQAAMEQAGFERLYAALLTIAEPALAYKRRKPAETLLHHLEENVLSTLRNQKLPLVELKASLQSSLDRLERQQEQMISAVWRTVLQTLPDLLEEHAVTRDGEAICDSLSRSVNSALFSAKQAYLSDCEFVQDEVPAQIDLKQDVGFDNLVIEVGGAPKVMGVDYFRLYAELEKQIRIQLFRLVEAAIDTCRASITGLIEAAARMDAILRTHEKKLADLKAELRLEAT